MICRFNSPISPRSPPGGDAVGNRKTLINQRFQSHFPTSPLFLKNINVYRGEYIFFLREKKCFFARKSEKWWGKRGKRGNESGTIANQRFQEKDISPYIYCLVGK